MADGVLVEETLKVVAVGLEEETRKAEGLKADDGAHVEETRKVVTVGHEEETLQEEAHGAQEGAILKEEENVTQMAEVDGEEGETPTEGEVTQMVEVDGDQEEQECLGMYDWMILSQKTDHHVMIGKKMNQREKVARLGEINHPLKKANLAVVMLTNRMMAGLLSTISKLQTGVITTLHDYIIGHELFNSVYG